MCASFIALGVLPLLHRLITNLCVYLVLVTVCIVVLASPPCSATVSHTYGTVTTPPDRAQLCFIGDYFSSITYALVYYLRAGEPLLPCCGGAGVWHSRLTTQS
jgi:hypothetical protein